MENPFMVAEGPCFSPKRPRALKVSVMGHEIGFARMLFVCDEFPVIILFHRKIMNILNGRINIIPVFILGHWNPLSESHCCFGERGASYSSCLFIKLATI